MPDPGRPFCARCKEDFPLAEKGQGWGMGLLFPLKKLDINIRRREGVNQWLEPDSFPEGRYICGNCYFDLTDSDA